MARPKSPLLNFKRFLGMGGLELRDVFNIHGLDVWRIFTNLETTKGEFLEFPGMKKLLSDLFQQISIYRAEVDRRQSERIVVRFVENLSKIYEQILKRGIYNERIQRSLIATVISRTPFSTPLTKTQQRNLMVRRKDFEDEDIRGPVAVATLKSALILNLSESSISNWIKKYRAGAVTREQILLSEIENNSDELRLLGYFLYVLPGISPGQADRIMKIAEETLPLGVEKNRSAASRQLYKKWAVGYKPRCPLK